MAILMLFMTVFGKKVLCCLSMLTNQTEKSIKSLRIMKRKYNPLQKSYSSLDLSSCSLTDLKNLPLLNLHNKGNFFIKSVVYNNSNSARKPATNYQVSSSSIKGFQSKENEDSSNDIQNLKIQSESLKLHNNPSRLQPPHHSSFSNLSNSTGFISKKYENFLFSERIKNQKTSNKHDTFLKNSYSRERNTLGAYSPVKTRKVFYSDRQSDIIFGVPSAPPSTPCYVVDFFASLSDLKSQRKFQHQLKRLESIRNAQSQKIINKIRDAEKIKAEVMLEQRKFYQRQQIYIMNKLMTELEKNQFEEFKMQQLGAPV